MYDKTLLRTKTATRLVVIIEDLLEIIPKGLHCPAVLHAHTAVKAHDQATKLHSGTTKPSRIRKKRIENILNFRNIEKDYRETTVRQF